MKNKTILLLLFVGLIYSNSYAQKKFKLGKDTLMYYMNYSGEAVNNTNFAQYVLVIMPADSTTGVKLYPIAEYYMTNKPKLFAYSKTKDYKSLIYEGPYVSYDRDGHKEAAMDYDDGLPKGNFTLYFPNGKPYADEFYKDNGDLLLINCWDSNGNALAKDGNGTWVEYTLDFQHVIRKGMIKDSLEQGDWYEKLGDKDETTIFNKGNVVSSTSEYRKFDICIHPQKEPKFIGDFGYYLSRNIRYPAEAKENNQQGKVYVQFIVNKDGALSYVHVSKSSGSKSLDNEAVRVLTNSPKWRPALKNNNPVSTLYTVPISFTLSSD